MKSNVIDLEVMYLHGTEGAVKVSVSEDAVWLPRSLIEIEGDQTPYGVVTVTLPEKLAIDKGLV